MSADAKILRKVISLILESDDDEDKDDDRRPQGAHEYRTATGEIVTIPDYANPPIPKNPFSWDDEATATVTSTQSEQIDVVRSTQVMADLKPDGSMNVSKKYNIKQSKYGDRNSPFASEGTKAHLGYDITRLDRNILGDDVVATEAGWIADANSSSTTTDDPHGGYGNFVLLAHGDKNNPTHYTLYGHMSSVYYTTKGASIRARETLGTVGSTGRSKGPHLHFEYRPGDNPSNPGQDASSYFRRSGIYYPIRGITKQ